MTRVLERALHRVAQLPGRDEVLGRRPFEMPRDAPLRGHDRGPAALWHGLASGNGALWLADNTQGVLYRVPA